MIVFNGIIITTVHTGTPSDISCDTPRPETIALSPQALQPTYEDDITHLSSTIAQPMTPFTSDSSALSPTFNVSLDSPYRSLEALAQPFATNSPDISQL